MSDSPTYTEAVQKFESKLQQFKTEMEKDYLELKEDISEIKRTNENIEKALVGDGFGNRGLADRIKDNEKRSQRNEERITKIWAYAVGAGIVMGVVFEIINQYVA